MNLTIVRRVIIGLVLIACAFLGVFAGNGIWKSTLEGTTVQHVYIVHPDGTKQYGPYCNQDGVKLEGGGVCRIVDEVTAYRRNDAIGNSILGGVLAGIFAAAFGWCVVAYGFDRIEARRKARLRKDRLNMALVK